MSWRYHGHAEVDPYQLDPFAVCDRCGGWYNHSNLRWQYQFAGTTVVNLRILVCPKCLDDMSPFLITPILPIDPPPVFDARPEPYSLDETSPTQEFTAQINWPDPTIGADFYIDLFDGNPISGGSSVLSAVTGSATRANAASSIGSPVEGICGNTVAITFTEASASSSNLTYIAVYDAATAGNLLASGPVFEPQTVVLYNGLAIPAQGLKVVLS